MYVSHHPHAHAFTKLFLLIAVLTLVPPIVWDAPARLVPTLVHEPLAAGPLLLVVVACFLNAVRRASVSE